MGKWVYIADPTETSAKDLKKMAGKLMTAAMTSKVDVTIEFNLKCKELDPTVRIVFFINNNSFFISLYSFYTVEKNTELLKMALLIMKDSTKFEEIKQQIKEI